MQAGIIDHLRMESIYPTALGVNVYVCKLHAADLTKPTLTLYNNMLLIICEYHSYWEVCTLGIIMSKSFLGPDVYRVMEVLVTCTYCLSQTETCQQN